MTLFAMVGNDGAGKRTLVQSLRAWVRLLMRADMTGSVD